MEAAVSLGRHHLFDKSDAYLIFQSRDGIDGIRKHILSLRPTRNRHPFISYLQLYSAILKPNTGYGSRSFSTSNCDVSGPTRRRGRSWPKLAGPNKKIVALTGADWISVAGSQSQRSNNGPPGIKIWPKIDDEDDECFHLFPSSTERKAFVLVHSFNITVSKTTGDQLRSVERLG